ncbi:MAG: fimbrial protein [Bacteroidales bacterium]|nr:fimbrial protein [Bacteroidales bacterium]
MKGRNILSLPPVKSGNSNRGDILAAALLSLVIVPAFFMLFSCSQNEFTEDEDESGNRPVTKIDICKPENTDIDNLDIFIFNDDSLMRLDSYQRINNPVNSYVEAASRHGRKIIFVVANFNDKNNWKDISSYESMKSRLSELSEENPCKPVMSGEIHMETEKDKSCSINLEPLMAQIHLNSLCCDFHNKPYKGKKLENIKIYLTNVNFVCGLLREKNYRPTVMVNCGGLEEKAVSRMAFPELLLKEMKKDVGENVVFPEGDFYCYPNNSDEETIGSPHTRLVIEGEIEGRKYYYPIDINETGFGYASGKKGLDRNTRYSLDVTITRTGTDDPDSPAETGIVGIECSAVPWNEKEESVISFNLDTGDYNTKSEDPDENVISDVNLFVFNISGELDSRKYFKESELSSTGKGASCKFTVLKNKSYSFYVCANTGYEIRNIKTKEDLLSYRYHMAYPDEYEKGIPMSGSAENITLGDKKDIDIPVKRAMSKISLSIDRTALDKGIEFYVSSVKIGGCPNSALLFNPSKAENERDVFYNGFVKKGYQTDALNTDILPGHSHEVNLYMLENMQGNPLDSVNSQNEKYFPDGDPRAGICSFIEIKSKYYSDSCYTKPGGYLIYRFYMGKDKNNFDIERNCHYHFIIKPEGNGLEGTGWRVVKTDILCKA